MRRGWILAALMLTMALAAMDITIVSTAIPQIVTDLGGFTKISWVFSIYLLAQTVTIPLYGKLSDLFGRKRVLIYGVVIFLIGSAASAAAWDIGSLIAFRCLQGLGAGSIMATVNTIAGDIFTVEERARVQGYLSSVWGISAIVGPALGGALAEYATWRWIFLINLPLGAAAIAVLVFFFKERAVQGHPKIDYKGAVLVTGTLSLLFIFLLEGGQSWAWTSPQSLALLAVVAALAFWTYRVEKATPHAILPIWVWRHPTLALTNLAVAGLGLAMMGPETFLPTFAQAYLGLGAIASGFVLASMSIGWPTASALSGRIYLRIGFRETSMIGAVLVLMASVGFLLIPTPQPVYLLVLDQVLIGAGFGLISTPSLVGIQSMVGWEQRGVVTGANVFTRNLGSSLGAAVMGAIFNTSLSRQLTRGPEGIPAATTDILSVIKDPVLPEAVRTFLREAINTAMHHVYWGLVLIALLTFLCLYRVPHRDPKDTTLVQVEQP